MSSTAETLTVAARRVRVTNPDEDFFPAPGKHSPDVVGDAFLSPEPLLALAGRRRARKRGGR